MKTHREWTVKRPNDIGISGGAVCRPLHTVVRRNHSLKINL
ncbi:MAG TPA: hypothetical protein VJ124_20385 [Pyrinomonadaceae bacterium]|nr:hypothetical protein [Pyrinomonadaceae bacterium]